MMVSVPGEQKQFIREFCAAYLAAACLRDGRAATQREVELAYEDAEKAWEAFEKARFRFS